MMLTFAFNALWQGAIVVLLTILVLRLASPKNATTRCGAWLLALIACVAVPIASVTSHLGAGLLALAPHHSHPASGWFSLVGIAPLPGSAPRWLASVTAVNPTVLVAAKLLWIAGSSLALFRLGISFVRIARIRRRASAFSSADGIAVLRSRDVAIPIAAGIFRPAIIVPEALAQAMDEHELRCTIEHELGHIRRGDVVANAAQRLLQALLFWNPWIHFVGRRLVDEREAACDDWAVCRIGEPDRYAASLAALGRRISASSAPLLTPSAYSSRNALVARIERLIERRSPEDALLNYRTLAGVALLFAALTLALQAAMPVSARAGTPPALSASNGVVASAALCKKPNAEPEAIRPAAPDLPKAQWPARTASAIVAVTVSPRGKATAASVYRSSGNAAVDRAVLTAAKESTYSPKIVNCTAVTGTYLFKADFAPQ